ncbi:MAG TPA: histidine phosphatase family protein [Burkholderiales bacterium]|nr:histidine phosphatase family protein [Burkholderiales bacterium]
MELILWRHAEAEDGTPDSGRKLTAKGRRQAAALAKWLRKRLPPDAQVLASPAMRCQQTASALGAAFETEEDIAVGASAAQLLKAVGWPAADGTVVVVGHQPTLGRVAALLLAEEKAEWNIKKGAVWWLSCRRRPGRPSVTLRAVIGPDLA